MSDFLVGLIVHAKFVLFEGWTFSTLNITLQKVYHVIHIHAWMEEHALTNQEETIAVSARADSVAKHVRQRVRAIWLPLFDNFVNDFKLEKEALLLLVLRT